MFTGIIEAIAPVEKKTARGGSLVLLIAAPRGWKVRAGDSIATNGVCLTVRRVARGAAWETELMPETLARTAFGKEVPKAVNLERSLTLGSALGGHLVTGHVDAVGKITKVAPRGASRMYTISFPARFARLVAEKGSIAVDGVSLTVVDAGRDCCTVGLVDYTLGATTLGSKGAGALVNIEFDILAKYVARLMAKSLSH